MFPTRHYIKSHNLGQTTCVKNIWETHFIILSRRRSPSGIFIIYSLPLLLVKQFVRRVKNVCGRSPFSCVSCILNYFWHLVHSNFPNELILHHKLMDLLVSVFFTEISNTMNAATAVSQPVVLQSPSMFYIFGVMGTRNIVYCLRLTTESHSSSFASRSNNDE